MKLNPKLVLILARDCLVTSFKWEFMSPSTFEVIPYSKAWPYTYIYIYVIVWCAATERLFPTIKD